MADQVLHDPSPFELDMIKATIRIPTQQPERTPLCDPFLRLADSLRESCQIDFHHYAYTQLSVD